MGLTAATAVIAEPAALARAAVSPAPELVHGAVSAPPATAAAIPAAAERFETATSRTLAAFITQNRGVPLAGAAAALSQIAQGIGISALSPTPDRLAPALSREMLLGVVAPALTAAAYAKSRIRLWPRWLPPDWFDDGMLTPVMPGPRFDRPMYQAVDAYDRGWLVPGLGTIAETDFVTVLTTNPVFTEVLSASPTSWDASCCGAIIRPTSGAPISTVSGTTPPTS